MLPSRVLRVLVVLLLLLLAGTSVPTAAGARPADRSEAAAVGPRLCDGQGVAVVPPPSGAYEGAYLAPNGQWDYVLPLEMIQDFQGLQERRLAWVNIISNWGLHGQVTIPFPTESVRHIWDEYGAIPSITWLPWTIRTENRRDPLISLVKIIRGDFDAEIRRFADDARDSGAPILLQFAHEMNGNWFPWAARFNGGPTAGPTRYRKAFRHVEEIFWAEGAANVTWAFHADAVSIPDAAWNTFEAYYPGDDYVDWKGLSAYGRTRPPRSPQDWYQLTDLLGDPNDPTAAYSQLAAVGPEKTMALFEVGVTEGLNRTDKAQWIVNAAAALQDTYPLVRGWSWWEESWDNTNLMIDSSPTTLAEYRRVISEPYFTDVPELECYPIGGVDRR